ncbi:MAG TPA: hypothetical protein VK400_06240 [Pyrinomonadaceae bacterium]|nr:hypothetical protein [Pyrinomonadaceae bacterium]
MASKSKKKDKKKSKSNDKIELEEIDEAAVAAAETETTNPTLLVLPGEVAAASEILDLNRKPGCKVKVLPSPDGQDDKKYEEAAAAALNSPDVDGYELLSVLPSADSKKLIAFFKLSK